MISKKIENIKNSKIRIFPLQTRDLSMMSYQDLPSLFLISLLVDKLGFKINQFSIKYLYPYDTILDNLYENLEYFEEEYFIFTLENFFHSSDYAYNFIEIFLEYLEKNKIEKKVIIHTLKTTNEDIKSLFNKYKNVLLVINTDIEYFFNEFFYKKIPIKNIKNIIFRNDDGTIIFTENENVEYDLSEYILGGYYNGYYKNFPKSKDEIISLRIKEKLPFYNDDYHYFWSNEKFIKNLRDNIDNKIMIETGRGCKFNCSYCYRGIKYSKIRQLSLDILKKDLDYIQSMGYEYIYIYDDCFISTNNDRLDEILELFSKYNFKYQIASRYETLTEENLNKLMKINISKIQIGLQSISKISNINSKRFVDLKGFISTIDNMKKNGINISIDLILGLPGDSLSDFIKTFNFAISLKPISIFINKLFINPKTELSLNKDYYGIVTSYDVGKKSLFQVPKLISSNLFTKKDILLAEKYVLASMKKLKDISITLR